VKLAWINQIVLVGAGGFIGAVLRFAISGAAQRLDPAGSFPYGTLACNVLGCLAIGLLAGLADARNVMGPGVRLFLLIGVLGGFTTFSSFAYETLELMRERQHLRVGFNVMGSVGLCLIAVWIGYGVAAR